MEEEDCGLLLLLLRVNQLSSQLSIGGGGGLENDTAYLFHGEIKD